MFGLIASKVCALATEAKARKEWLDSLPKDEADKIRSEYAIRDRDNELHRRAIEIAEAGRPRNFWGK